MLAAILCTRGGAAPVKDQSKQGGIHRNRLNLLAQFRGVEPEDRKRLRREAAGIIRRIKTARPDTVAAVQVESKVIAGELQEAIRDLRKASDAFAQEMQAQKALRAQKQADELQALLTEARRQIEALQQQAEELDVVYLTFMLAAHL